ncbi:MAG: sigma-70 family RNA polymerase sigma factor [Proteobacteria bacterium]|nr:sigma-70 family RNA polymerase sigma factor [Pseudomonadota bacterium]MBU1137742.1 sigma-70 family RNA polymerase sigma factor [Pseudomonadota bacterium]MBU1416900.1 sigma-70 family RNA polymerase sigma factor [Pseudomonadota bacterium]MBU1454055.1 sigma-70 family RNA polymerase sigma factor [Pseudomonadota bacterium]
MNTFREFYSDNKDRFFGYLLRRSGDHYLAADTLQESFTRYLERYGNGEFSISLLFTIGRNLLNDNSRRQRTTVPFEEERHKSTCDEESAFLVREESRRVLNALQQLDPEEIKVMSLVVSKGLSYKKIAELTGTSESNIKVKIHRSRLKLKKILRAGEL